MKTQTDYDEIIVARAAHFMALRRQERRRAIKWFVFTAAAFIAVPLLVFAVAALISPAHAAEYACDKPVVYVGEVGSNPATSVRVAYNQKTAGASSTPSPTARRSAAAISTR
jgi:hypothetical protein